MNIDNKYLYEIIDDYKNANSTEEKNEIFNSFFSSVWGNNNKRRVYNKQIKFNVRSDLLESEIGQIFNTWSEVDYIGYKAMTNDTDWCSLIRQKINNLYTRYFDERVILKKDYMNLLRTPKKLYYRWVNGEEMDSNELIASIDDAIHKSVELKSIYQKQKIELSWGDYKNIIEEFLKRAFDNCKSIDDYEINNKLLNIYDLYSEDNFYIKYFCKSLEGELQMWQKKHYEVRQHQDYKRCKECGKMIENTGNKKMYCNNCADIIEKKNATIRKRKQREKEKMSRNRNLLIHP